MTTAPTFTVHHADALEVLRAMPSASVDTILTDPPYSSGGRRENSRICRVDGCPLAGVEQPAGSREEALAEADRHYRDRHYSPDPPADLDEQRAAWHAAGRPPLGRHAAK